MIEINNLNAKEFFKLGYQNQKNKNFKEAIKLYNKVIKIEKSAVLAYYNLGLIYEQTSNTELAMYNYNEAIKAKPLFIYAYNNLGILFQREGNKAKAVENFKKVIKIDSKFVSGYNNLGLSYASSGKYSDAIDSYLYTLKLDEKNIIAIKGIIFLLTYYIPDKNHLLINVNNNLRQLQNKLSLKELLKNENLKSILKNSLEIIKKTPINLNNLNFIETQAYRRNPIDLNCERHHKVYNYANIIPKFCFNCFKIQIEVHNVLNLIKLFFIFDKLNLSENNRRKCMVEFRDNVSGVYKGLIYCSSLNEANLIVEKINPLLKTYLRFKLSIKRGCTEFYKSFPNYKIINKNQKDYMNYKKEWHKIEEILEIKSNFNEIKLNHSIQGLSIVDFLVINQWLNYAKTIGDLSYKEIDIKFFHSEFISNTMSKQVEIRKKEFAEQLI
tara:strand:- start:464 stop:1783 length:1320 start_codon:yes stop_codon:yes gene_type:complete